jgi:hypothetical protein
MARELIALEPTPTLVFRVAVCGALGLVGGATGAWIGLRAHSALWWGAAALCVAVTILQLMMAAFFLHDLLRRRVAWRTLSMLTDMEPDGWRGPYLLGARDGAVAWGIDHPEDGDRSPELVRIHRKTRDGELLLVAFAASREGNLPPARGYMLLRQLLDAPWQHLARGDLSTFVWSPGDPRRPVVLRDATRRPRAPERPRFTPAIELPAPIAFPREAFAAELARHEEIVRAHLDVLAFQTRSPAQEPFGPYDGVNFSVGLIDVRGGEERPARVDDRAYAAYVFERLLGVRHRLQLHPEHEVLEVIVRSEDVVSLHVTRVRTVPRGKTTVTRSLALETPAAVFEPTRQEQARQGGRLAVYWQAASGGEIHEAFTTVPEPARSHAEATDRLFALRIEHIRRAVWGGGGQGLSEGFVWYVDNGSSGEAAMRVEHRHEGMLGFLQGQPAIRRALAEHRAYGDWYPVVVDCVRHAGLRWLPMRAGLDESTRPAPVDEANRESTLQVVEGGEQLR